MSIIDEIKRSYHQGGALIQLVYINIAVFIIIRLLQTFLPMLEWLSVPSEPLSLLYKPWTLFSYMFVHYEFLHVIFNLIYLFWFGRIFLEFFNPRQLLGVYLLGGLSGALLYLAAYNFIPVLYQHFPSSILMGASASVMAILFAVARYMPDHRIYLMFFGAVKLKYIALAAFIIDLISIPTLENTGGHIAHMGGALFGLLYGGSMMKGKDVTTGFNRFMDSVASLFSRKAKMTVTHKRPITDLEYNTKKVDKQREVDRILEKIKSSGYDSLTKDEKKTLFEASKE